MYFWLYAVLSVVGVFTTYTGMREWQFVDRLEIISTVIAVLGLYSYSYGRRIFEQPYWKVGFWILIGGAFAELVYRFTPITFLSEFLKSRIISSGEEAITGILFSLPVLYCLHQLAYGEHSVTQPPPVSKRNGSRGRKTV